MLFKFAYESMTERENIIKNNNDKWMVEEQVLIDGNFLIFTDVKPLDVAVSEIQSNLQNTQLQVGALDGKTEMLEGAIVELASLTLQ